MKKPTIRKTASGFTLMEILISISIIVVLALLSFFGFARMRKSADRVVATRNISQLQIANALYASDHNGKYVPLLKSDGDGAAVPGEKYWMTNSKFLRNLRGEPGREDDTSVEISLLDPVVVRAKKTGWQNLDSSFGYNRTDMPGGGQPGNTWMNNGANPSFSVHQVVDPGRTACFITGTDFIISYGGRFRWKNEPVEGRSTNQKIAYRHNGKALVAYYDGHVGDVSMADMEAIDKNQGGATAPFWKADAK